MHTASPAKGGCVCANRGKWRNNIIILAQIISREKIRAALPKKHL